MMKQLNAGDDEVLKPIRQYLEGVKQGEAYLLIEAFSPGATITSVISGKIEAVPLAEFIVFVEAMRRLHSNLEEKHHEYRIETLGEISTVRVAFDFVTGEKTSPGTDIFSLGRTDGRWRIVHKLYSM